MTLVLTLLGAAAVLAGGLAVLARRGGSQGSAPGISADARTQPAQNAWTFGGGDTGS